jgi:peptidoglycan/LPS O-acetylase OafA/YrhL
MTRWADNTWEHAVQWHAVWQHVLFIGRYDPSQFNTAFWTLIIEMRISILFPLLCFIVLRVKPWISLPAVVFVSIAATYLEMQHNLGLIPGIAGMCHYAGMFVVGILLARYKDRLTKLASSLSRRTGGLCLAGALLLFLFGMASVTLIGRTWFGQPPMWMPAFDLVSLLGAASIIVLSLGFLPLKHLLLTRIPQFLGRVSYSMYLIHSTFLFALLHAVGKKIAGFELLLIYVPSVLLASAVMYRLVEKPLMDLGRKVSTRI